MIEGHGIRLILGLIEDEKYLALEGIGKIIRDKAFIYSKGTFSAWRVLYIQRGEEWVEYDGFNLDKIINNDDGKGVYEDSEDCEDCEEF